MASLASAVFSDRASDAPLSVGSQLINRLLKPATYDLAEGLPADKLVDCVAVRYLRTGCCERIQHCVFRLFQVGEPKDCLGFGSLRRLLPTRHTDGLLSRGVSMEVNLAYSDYENPVSGLS